jgi:HKD family nuclease
MKKHFLIIFLIFFSFVFVTNGFSISGNITPIPKNQYFDIVHSKIQSAKSSITMAMFFISLHKTTGESQVLQLVNDLIDARNRGVKVKVILDKTMNFKNNDDDAVEPGAIDNKNKTAYEYLKKNGVEVYYDDDVIYTHAKCIVIDDKIVIAGSTNWSASAFTSNNEVSMVIESVEYAKEVLRQIENIKVSQDISFRDEDYLIFNLDMMKTFLKFIRSKNYELGYRMYLYILLYTTKTGEIRKPGNEEVEIDYKKSVEYLGLSSLDNATQRFYIRRTLKKLEKNFGLITYLNPNDFVNNPKIILQDKPFLSTSPHVIQDSFLEFPPLFKGGLRGISFHNSSSFLYIPKKFFEYGWHNRLNLQEQYCYFINLLEGGRENNIWSKSINELVKEYGLKDKFICKSMSKLRYWNLLTIKYDAVEDGNYAARSPNEYKLNELYSMEDYNERLKKKLDEMNNKYGSERIDRVREYMRIVCSEYDLDEMDIIISLEDTYGVEKVKKVFDIAAKVNLKAKSKRGMGYIVGILKKA